MPKQPIRTQAGQSAEEMAIQMLESKADNHLYNNRKETYKEVSDRLKSEALTAAIEQQEQMLTQVKQRGRINLDSLEEVEQTAREYLQACKLSGTVPTLLGYAAACGYSRRFLYEYIARMNTPTARYIDALRSSFAAILAQMGLTRQASEPVTIFLLKNSGQALADKTELDINAQQTSPLGETRTEAELEAEYSEMLDSIVTDD